jgi:hypothetical protein
MEGLEMPWSPLAGEGSVRTLFVVLIFIIWGVGGWLFSYLYLPVHDMFAMAFFGGTAVLSIYFLRPNAFYNFLMWSYGRDPKTDAFWTFNSGKKRR